MQAVRADFPTDWPHANVYTLADLHIGDAHCSESEVLARVKAVQDDPYGLCVLNGDLMNTALRNSVSDVYGEVLSPMEQINYLVTMLRPIAGKVIGVTAGIIKSPLSTWDEWGVLPDSDLSGEIYETFDIVPMDTLKKGSKGEVVKWYQRSLVELGYDVGKAKDGSPLIDGIYGTEMVSATREFQYKNGLNPDGMAGKLTMAKLKELLEDDEPEEDTEVDFDELVDPWDELSLEEKVEDLHQWRLSQMRGGESNG